jgi:hypothetical protein
MQDPQQPPTSPLDYEHAQPPKPRAFLPLVILGLLFGRTARLIYLGLCLTGAIFAARFLLHYRQILEDAMKQK